MCGHVGNGYYVPIEFAVEANSRGQAKEIARAIPRVKHNNKDCILKFKKISFDEFESILLKNSEDPYLHCKSDEDQSKIDMSGRIYSYNLENKFDKKKTNDNYYDYYHNVYKGKFIKKAKKYINKYLNAGAIYKYEEFKRIGI